MNAGSSRDEGGQPALANAEVSAVIESLDGTPIVAERAMWWPGPTFTTWTDAHNGAGAIETATIWVAALGHVQ